MEGIVAADNVRRAWRRVRRNRGAPGIDGMRVEDFPAHARDHWSRIKQALLDAPKEVPLGDGMYSPQPVRRVSIPKPGGGERLLGIPTVVDRIIQQAIAQVMGPIFDEGFSESSFGFPPGRGAHGALRQVQANIKAGYRIGVDLDLAKFFDNVQHDILMARMARKVGDTGLLALIPEIDQWLRRRVRMCYWKRWRLVRTKVRKLLALGVGKREAIMAAISSKSYWRLSKTLATQLGMTNQWLKEQGLISVRDLWMKAHGYA